MPRSSASSSVRFPATAAEAAAVSSSSSVAGSTVSRPIMIRHAPSSMVRRTKESRKTVPRDSQFIVSSRSSRVFAATDSRASRVSRSR
ncbi:hypothetical protein [Amycolatopsis granulosa]|uniref:hypothetical protein n=1 Tax=Amycolatopsis granulosa TaxID=185684 RepID=UPI0014240A06|nr:hypothetical protein [Amycolatopsis granulosa]NIH88288.1 hypothetical protein [Amycolatopsis granulosa]